VVEVQVVQEGIWKDPEFFEFLQQFRISAYVRQVIPNAKIIAEELSSGGIAPWILEVSGRFG
jgi:hypothetical protein